MYDAFLELTKNKIFKTRAEQILWLNIFKAGYDLGKEEKDRKTEITEQSRGSVV